jgi:hypothetical protein
MKEKATVRLRISRPVARSLGVLTAGALLAGCNGAGSPSSGATGPSWMNAAQAPGTAPLDLFARAALTAQPPTNHRHDSRQSWMSAQAQRSVHLFFQADYGSDDVYVFSLPMMKLVGTLTGFDGPQGECSDASGNIWITNTLAKQILQYSHNGTRLKTLNDPSGYPVGCAVDLSNNKLAVTNIFNFSGSGEVLVYANASGKPTALTNPDQYSYYFAGYGPSGDLYVSGRNSKDIFMLSKCAAGGNSCSTIKLSGGTVYFPGFVQWYSTRKYLAVGDQLCGKTNAACVYWVEISGSKATIAGVTHLDNYEGGKVCDLTQGVIAAPDMKQVAGGDYEYCRYTASTSYRWAYDAGGKPMNYNNTAGQDIPSGAAISTK